MAVASASLCDTSIASIFSHWTLRLLGPAILAYLLEYRRRGRLAFFALLFYQLSRRKLTCCIASPLFFVRNYH